MANSHSNTYCNRPVGLQQAGVRGGCLQCGLVKALGDAVK
jgi:hypothetical protein